MSLALEYERDFDSWIQQHIALLKQGRVTEIDVEHLIEELEDMGKNHRRELVNYLMSLIARLLEWQYKQLQDEWNTFIVGNWKGRIMEQRFQIEALFEQNPCLKTELSESVIKAYPDAVNIAIAGTGRGLSKPTLPEKCPYTIEQLLDKNFYPDPQD
jgi:hypothetical protein